MSASLKVQRLSGSAIEPYLSELARLRIQVFREFPYLYQGSAAYEEKYLKTYLGVPDSVMVLIRDGEQVVGASSGLPLAAEPLAVIEPVAVHGYDSQRVFYYGESVLLPEYRSLGLGRRFFEEREAHVRGLGRFDLVCFCAVERPAGHPRRPAAYRPLDAFWNRCGFVKYPELRITFSWRDLDEDVESPKPMVFWLKHLA